MKRLSSLILLLSPIPAFFLSIFIGAYHISFLDIVKTVLGFKSSEAYRVVILDIRAPRIILAMFVGSALSISGATLQAVFRNPLVDSFILGISSGAAFGAALGIGFSLGVGVTPLAFLFALVAVFLTYSLAKIGGKISPISLILAGIIINAFFSAMTELLKLLMEHEKLAGVIYWLMGSFSGADWDILRIVGPVVMVGSVIIYFMRWHLNILSFGDEAKILGVEVEKLKLIFIGIVSLITAAATSFCGIIGWVGLMVPHIIRMGFGPDHKLLIPLSITTGATFMVIADTISRSVFSFELPIGILTTLLGIPFFAYLLKKTGGGWYA